jgi:bifunctional non-homologous end joining protein LigD
LGKLANETVIDGEIVAFDADGRPSFNALQNQRLRETLIIYFVFDVMILAGRDLRGSHYTYAVSCLSARSCPS